LTAYREAQRRRVDIARSTTENQLALEAARQRYSGGATNFLNVTTTQAQLLQSENDLADSDTEIATDLVNLYRALGGGWKKAALASGQHEHTDIKTERIQRCHRRRFGIPRRTSGASIKAQIGQR
jgi:outer membrane protein TolC